MRIKRLKCPVCGQNVSFFWNYFSLANMTHTCSNCKSEMGWYQMIRFYSILCGLIMLSLFSILANFISSPYIALIIALILAQIIFMLTPKRVKLLIKNIEEEN